MRPRYVIWVVGVVLLAAVVASVIAILSEPGRPAPSSSLVQSQPIVHRIGVERLLGLLDLSVQSPTGSDGKAWIFVDGHLLGKLPIANQIRLAGGTYELRVVSVEDGKFLIRSRPINISTGETNTISQDQSSDSWAQWNVTNPPLQISLPWSDFNYGLRCRSLLDWEKEYRELVENEEKKWDAFTESELWAPISEAAGYTRLTRNYVWMELPLALGGAREIDTSQLEALEGLYESHLPRGAIAVSAPDVNDAAERNAIQNDAKNRIADSRKGTHHFFQITFWQLRRNLNRQLSSAAGSE